MLTNSTSGTAAIEQWLIAHIACSAKLDVEEIDINQPFSHYALDSVATVELTADLEDRLDLQLQPTLLWDYPTIASLARHLATLEATAS
jgi:acyl carrier protein